MNSRVKFLENIKDNLQEAKLSIRDILNNQALSKGMKVKEMLKENKRISQATNRIEQFLLNKKKVDEIDGAFDLRMITSKGRLWYTVDGFATDFMVEQTKIVDPDNPEFTKIVYAVCMQAEGKRIENITDVNHGIVIGVFETLMLYPDREEELENFKFTNIYSIVKQKLENNKA